MEPLPLTPTELQRMVAEAYAFRELVKHMQVLAFYCLRSMLYPRHLPRPSTDSKRRAEYRCDEPDRILSQLPLQVVR